MRLTWKHLKLRWKAQEDNDEYQAGSAAFFDAAHSIIDTQSAITMLAITVPAEIMAFVMIHISKDEVYKFLDSGPNAWVFAAVGAFVIGFMTPLAVLRLMPLRVRRSVLTAAIWPIAIIAGFANIGLFVALLTFKFPW